MNDESKESKNAYAKNLERKNVKINNSFVETKSVNDIIDGSYSRVTEMNDSYVKREEIKVNKSPRWIK